MDGALTQPEPDVSYVGPPPILIAGDSEAARHRAAATIRAAGLRIADQVPVSEAVARIDRQISSGAIWLELDGDGGAQLDHLLDRLNGDVSVGRYPAVVAAPLALVDALSARLSDPAIALLIDGDETERAAALAIAMSGVARTSHVADVASDNGAARLRQLSDEVARIAATLARLSTGPQPSPVKAPSAEKIGDAPAIDPDAVRAIIRARRLRARYFDAELFADPAWDMLLDLVQAEIDQLRVPVSSLCIAAAVPATTALRWIKTMTDSGLFVRRADPHDGRRVFVEMSQDTSLAMRRYFAEIGQPRAV
ncbi:MAG TPA: MarR family transcriptional regulator [Sphingomicrobium sp.]|nr:MarR family transcriptional regulator [Sphingomicrobium sp.]